MKLDEMAHAQRSQRSGNRRFGNAFSQTKAAEPWVCRVCTVQNTPRTHHCSRCGMPNTRALKGLISSAATPMQPNTRNTPRSEEASPYAGLQARPMAGKPSLGWLPPALESPMVAARYLRMTGFADYADACFAARSGLKSLYQMTRTDLEKRLGVTAKADAIALDAELERLRTCIGDDPSAVHSIPQWLAVLIQRPRRPPFVEPRVKTAEELLVDKVRSGHMLEATAFLQLQVASELAEGRLREKAEANAAAELVWLDRGCDPDRRPSRPPSAPPSSRLAPNERRLLGLTARHQSALTHRPRDCGQDHRAVRLEPVSDGCCVSGAPETSSALRGAQAAEDVESNSSPTTTNTLPEVGRPHRPLSTGARRKAFW